MRKAADREPEEGPRLLDLLVRGALAPTLDRAYALVGESCWRCGYTRGRLGRRVLDFHHVDPAAKAFSLDCRHVINMAWHRVTAEMRKCVLLCANCHRECETGLVQPAEILRLHRTHWEAAGGMGEGEATLYQGASRAS